MITDVQLQNFRSYQDASFDFGPELNVIVGPNASGKTNLVEAILVMSIGNSYRVKDIELISYGADWARVDAVTDNQHRVVKLQPIDTGNGKKAVKTFEIDDNAMSRLHHSKSIPVVLFEPDHMHLISSIPDLRRAFLDDLIEQIDTSFGSLRRNYRRVLSQRNALLKNNPLDLRDQLFVWNLRLSELAGKIAKAREELLVSANALLPDIYNSLAKNKAEIKLGYLTPFNGDYQSGLLRKLEQNVDMDLLRGFTAYGPHRDDLAIILNGHMLQDSASRGEVRSVVLALKIIELKLLEEARELKPILLLDDVYSELDNYRRAALSNYVEQYQTFLTTTEADNAPKKVKSTRRTINL